MNIDTLIYLRDNVIFGLGRENKLDFSNKNWGFSVFKYKEQNKKE
jgi:hypothetical protein